MPLKQAISRVIYILVILLSLQKILYLDRKLEWYSPSFTLAFQEEYNKDLTSGDEFRIQLLAGSVEIHMVYN